MAPILHTLNLRKDKISLHDRSQDAFSEWLNFPRDTHLWQFSTATLENLLSKNILKAGRRMISQKGTNHWLVVANFEAYHILQILRNRGFQPQHITASEVQISKDQIETLATHELKLLFLQNVTKRNASRAFQLFLKFPPDVQTEIIGHLEPSHPNNDMRSFFAAHFNIRKRQLKAPRKLAHTGDSKILHHLRYPRK